MMEGWMKGKEQEGWKKEERSKNDGYVRKRKEWEPDSRQAKH